MRVVNVTSRLRIHRNIYCPQNMGQKISPEGKVTLVGTLPSERPYRVFSKHLLTQKIGRTAGVLPIIGYVSVGNYFLFTRKRSFPSRRNSIA